MKAVTKKEPLFHVTRRENYPFRKKVLIRVLSVVLAFILCAVILFAHIGFSPLTFTATLFDGAIGSSFNLFIFLGNLAILLGFAIALVPAFRMKFWNIGADGQALMGALAAYVVLYFGTIRGNMNGVVACILSLLAAIVAGAIWGVIPAIFKAYFNTNETLFTLMMNYIAIQIVLFFKNYVVFTIQKGNKTTIPIPDEGTLPSIFDVEQILPVLIVASVVILVTLYLTKTKEGFELSLVGDSENTARYAGINVKFVIIRTMIISGGICGLVGWLLITGNHQAVADDITHSMGFTAIIVTWLANFNPLYMVLTAGLVAFLQSGMKDVMSKAGITSDAITNIFIGVFFFFIIAFEFFISYKINVRKKDNGDIDNKLLDWNYKKVYVPVASFMDKAVDKMNAFFRKIYCKIRRKSTDDLDVVKVDDEEDK